MKLIDLLNKMANMELVKVRVYVSGATFERLGSVQYWNEWDSRFTNMNIEEVTTDRQDECIAVTLIGDLL